MREEEQECRENEVIIIKRNIRGFGVLLKKRGRGLGYIIKSE